MHFKNFIGALTALALLGGCAAATSINDVEKLNDTAAVGSEFTRALATEYRELANFEQFEMYDYRDAKYHADKGLMAAQGEVVLPTEMSERDIDDAHVGELQVARGRLMSAFNKDARNLFPNEAAVAQTRFDCWMEQQEEGFQLDHIRACREEFRAAIAALEGKMNAQPVAAEGAERFIVFFGFDSVEIPASAASILANAARTIEGKDGAVVDIVGHADTSGDATYNQGLSERRAAAVQQALSGRGIAIDKMTTSGRGERALLIETADGVREPSNRRAEIILR